jgi:hypothetical protein
MKLAELLIDRGDLQHRLAALKSRISKSAKTQDGGQSAVNLSDLIDQSVNIIDQLEDITVRINRASAEITLPNGESLMRLHARREATLRCLSLFQHALSPSRYSLSEHYKIKGLAVPFEIMLNESRFHGNHSEVKWSSKVDVPALRIRCDELVEEAREVNLTIQAVNWTADIPEPTN